MKSPWCPLDRGLGGPRANLYILENRIITYLCQESEITFLVIQQVAQSIVKILYPGIK
jgi:hypothetical protein